MNRKRTVLPIIVVLAMLALACSVCGNLGQPKSTAEEIATEVSGAVEGIEKTAEAVEATVVIPTPVEEFPAETEEAFVEPDDQDDAVDDTGDAAGDESTADGGSVEGAAGEEEDIDVDMSLSDLENFDSYRSNMYVEWEGTEGGQPTGGYFQIESAFVREPPAAEMHISSDGFDSDQQQGDGTVSFVRVGDNAWFFESQSGTWIQVPGDTLDFEQDFYNFTPEDFLSGADIGKARRNPVPVEVNGVLCNEYIFDEKGLTDASGQGITRAQGKVYVAVDGGYMVKLLMEADTKSLMGDTAFDEGTIYMELGISDINQPITIEPPAEIEEQQSKQEDIPMLPDANIEFSSAELITYLTGSSVADAAAFYEDQMPANGWTVAEGSMAMEDMAMMSYQKDNRLASIIISVTDEEGTSILISLETQ